MFSRPGREQIPAAVDRSGQAEGGWAGVWENPLWKKDTGMLSASWDKRLEKKGASQWMVLKMGWKTGETGPCNEKQRKCLFCCFPHHEVRLPPPTNFLPDPFPSPSHGAQKKGFLLCSHLPAAHPHSFISAQGLAVGPGLQLPEMLDLTSNLPKMGIWETSVYNKTAFSSKYQKAFFAWQGREIILFSTSGQYKL